MKATSGTIKTRVGNLGKRIEFLVTGDHVKARVVGSPADVRDDGFGMLKSGRNAVPADLDPAVLLKPR